MTPDDAHTSHNHGFELPNAPLVVERNGSRPWRALAGVAVCLGLAGVVTGIVVAHRQRVSDAHLTSDALQREELRDGWRALGVAAAQDALNNNPPPSPAVNSAAAAPPNVVIVNVPAQSPNTTPPSNVTNITVPGGSAPGSTAAPQPSSTVSPSYTPIQSMPPISFSPVPGYAPPQGTYVAPSANTEQPSGDSASNVAGIGTGSSPSGAAPYTPPVGNGSIPGSTPNPALPNNNGLVGSTPTPGQPNGPVNGGLAP